MRLIEYHLNRAASVAVIGVTLAYYGILFAKDDDTRIIRQFMDLCWKRQASEGRMPMFDWARWCKVSMQLGEIEICPPR